MTIDEAILICEEISGCRNIKDEEMKGRYRQLAEWLKELKRYHAVRGLIEREQRENLRESEYLEGYGDALSNVIRMIEFGEEWDK